MKRASIRGENRRLAGLFSGSCSLALVVGCAVPVDPTMTSADPATGPRDAEAAEALEPIRGRPIDGGGDNVLVRADAPAERRFELEHRPARVAIGEASVLSLHVRTVDDWHVNQEYETALVVAAGDDVRLDKSKLGREDASAYADEQFQFEVPFVAHRAGKTRITGELRFALCRGSELCTVIEEPLDIELTVD